MKHLLLLLILTALFRISNAQIYTSSNIHAHNDYVNPRPFYGAYDEQVGSIESDVFLVDNKLCVAHDAHEIAQEKTLDNMYLRPLDDAIKKNNGSVYKDPEKSLILLIDLKSKGIPTLKALVTLLEKYPALMRASTLKFVISGDVPDTSLWNQFPAYIYFDGRPSRSYTEKHLKRIGIVSDNFSHYSSWKGDGPFPDKDKKNVLAIINKVHADGKKIRFWATADNEITWSALIASGVNFIGTDSVAQLSQFLVKRKGNR